MIEIISSRKEKLFRGKTVEELKQIDTREFAKFLKTKQRRWLLRNFHVIEESLRKWDKKLANNKIIKTHKRDLVIIPKMVGKTIGVYNGKDFIQVKINEEMLGHRLGEFALTRKATKHGAPGVGATKSSAALSVK